MNAVTAFAWKPDSSIGVVDVLKRQTGCKKKICPGLSRGDG
jgi:hypothetical protein